MRVSKTSKGFKQQSQNLTPTISRYAVTRKGFHGGAQFCVVVVVLMVWCCGAVVARACYLGDLWGLQDLDRVVGSMHRHKPVLAVAGLSQQAVHHRFQRGEMEAERRGEESVAGHSTR